MLFFLALFCNYTFSQYFDTHARVVTFNGEINLLQNGKYFLLDKQVITVKLSGNEVMPSNINVVRVNGLGYYDIKIPNDVGYEDYMNHLKSLKIFSVIEYNAIDKYNGEIESNDKKITNQWYLSRIKVLDAWNITFGEESIKIGVLDSGLDWTHQDIGLGRDLYQNVYLNSKEDLWRDSNNPTTGDSQDNDNNGFVDDLKGSIIEGREIEATITYASAKKGNPHYSDVYWITYGMNHYIVCNEAILPQKAKDLKHNEGQYLTVKCRGMLKELCHKQMHPAVVTYYHIELTKI